MRLIRFLVAAAIIVGVPVLSATAAHATISGPCTAGGTIGKHHYDARQASALIPRKGTVRWTGAISKSGGKRNIEGKVYLKLPPPFGHIVIANGSWDGPSSSYANRGKYHYDLPTALVGPKFTLYGHHAERGSVVCTGTMELRLEGSRWKNPAIIASLVLTLLAVINMGFVLRVKAIR